MLDGTPDPELAAMREQVSFPKSSELTV